MIILPNAQAFSRNEEYKMNNAKEKIISRIDALISGGEPVIIAIDGSCTSGKTTLAGWLAAHYGSRCSVFHMDDFFLRPHQRTYERLNEAGGNVDYERFAEEILANLVLYRAAGTNAVFSYRPYDCRVQKLAESVDACAGQISIIEGTYSMHPFFYEKYGEIYGNSNGEIYDLKIYMTVSDETRRRRILERPEFLHERFFNEWIPMEQNYFSSSNIENRCDIIIDSSEPVL